MMMFALKLLRSKLQRRISLVTLPSRVSVYDRITGPNHTTRSCDPSSDSARVLTVATTVYTLIRSPHAHTRVPHVGLHPVQVAGNARVHARVAGPAAADAPRNDP